MPYRFLQATRSRPWQILLLRKPSRRGLKSTLLPIWRLPLRTYMALLDTLRRVKRVTGWSAECPLISRVYLKHLRNWLHLPPMPSIIATSKGCLCAPRWPNFLQRRRAKESNGKPRAPFSPPSDSLAVCMPSWHVRNSSLPNPLPFRHRMIHNTRLKN